jgi:EmrB/QacA subfamily drug resistance transporter
MTITTSAPTALATNRGKLILALLCAVGFLDFIDVTIVNVALPSIRSDLGFSLQELQWVPSGYLLTYGGFMLLGGRAADLLGRRRVLVAGIVLFGLASLVGGFANTSEVLVASRLIQGIGAAMTLPAALSVLTTTFAEGSDRHTALGVWGGVAGLASAVGVLLGGIITEGPGWRWVMFINPVICVLLLPAVYRLIGDDRRKPSRLNFDVLGTVLATGSMLLLVYTLVEAPDVGWGASRTIGGLAGALALLMAFLVTEARSRNPLVPLSIFKIRGLAAANATQLIAFAGFVSMFFFLTLYMQNVLGYSPIKTGLAYLPLCFAIGISAGISSQLITKVGTRPLIVAGAIITAAGVYLLSRIPVDGSFVSDLLPGMLVLSFGIGAVFVAVATAANAGVPSEQAGLAAALLNSSQQIGGVLGLAVLTAIGTARTNDLLAARASMPEALTEGFQRSLLVGSIFLFAAAFIGLRVTNTREFDA